MLCPFPLHNDNKAKTDRNFYGAMNDIQNKHKIKIWT